MTVASARGLLHCFGPQQRTGTVPIGPVSSRMDNNKTDSKRHEHARNNRSSNNNNEHKLTPANYFSSKTTPAMDSSAPIVSNTNTSTSNQQQQQQQFHQLLPAPGAMSAATATGTAAAAATASNDGFGYSSNGNSSMYHTGRTSASANMFCGYQYPNAVHQLHHSQHQSAPATIDTALDNSAHTYGAGADLCGHYGAVSNGQPPAYDIGGYYAAAATATTDYYSGPYLQDQHQHHHQQQQQHHQHQQPPHQNLAHNHHQQQQQAYQYTGYLSTSANTNYQQPHHYHYQQPHHATGGTCINEPISSVQQATAGNNDGHHAPVHHTSLHQVQVSSQHQQQQQQQQQRQQRRNMSVLALKACAAAAAAAAAAASAQHRADTVCQSRLHDGAGVISSSGAQVDANKRTCAGETQTHGGRASAAATEQPSSSSVLLSVGATGAAAAAGATCASDKERRKHLHGRQVSRGSNHRRGNCQQQQQPRRKNATRETTATLKDWLEEHGQNPYPTKGEKIMLSIITKMSLTQVSTWFANARRRMKKENKAFWLQKPPGQVAGLSAGGCGATQQQVSTACQRPAAAHLLAYGPNGPATAPSSTGQHPSLSYFLQQQQQQQQQHQRHRTPTQQHRADCDNLVARHSSAAAADFRSRVAAAAASAVKTSAVG